MVIEFTRLLTLDGKQVEVDLQAVLFGDYSTGPELDEITYSGAGLTQAQRNELDLMIDKGEFDDTVIDLAIDAQ